MAPIVGVTRLDHLYEMVAVISLELGAAHVTRLEAAYTPRAFLDIPWPTLNFRVLDR